MDLRDNENVNYNDSIMEQGDEIAIIGIAGKFPGANNISDFWENLKNGVCSIKSMTKEEALEKGVPENFINDPAYILKQGILDEPYLFGSDFFSYSPKEASFIDPQQRLFLECCWEAAEDAGYIPDQIKAKVGVFAASGLNSYFLKNIISRYQNIEEAIDVLSFIGNEKDFISTRVSYKLNYGGPSYTVQSACSSSLVAFHIACQNILTYQCDMALCGGVSLVQPRAFGYQYQDGEILSKSGFLRVFDDKADGTIFGEGVGVVLLKRLDEALADNDHIYAIVKSSAINNDGLDKMGFTAPSINGQSQAIEFALEMAEINPETVGYIEAHGTGTKLGDPIEVASLTQSYRKWTSKKNYCALGSVKSNIGHLDVAAGITGLIKTVLCLKHKKLLPQIGYSTPNPDLFLSESPFYINQDFRDWQISSGQKRRAAISSFGLGGTNAHVVLEEASPRSFNQHNSGKYCLLTLSAKSSESLFKTIHKYNELNYNDYNIEDIAFTLTTGRKNFNFRHSIVCNNTFEFVNQCRLFSEKERIESKGPEKIVFLFPGQGSQYLKMGMDLYKNLASFRYNFDYCCKVISNYSNTNLYDLLVAENQAELIHNTEFSQLLLFAVQYSLAISLINLGIRPDALLGHSLGEITAACVSGIFSVEDALKLLIYRSKTMARAPQGKMLAIALSAGKVKEYLNDKVFISAENSDSQTVVSGYDQDIIELSNKLLQADVRCRILENTKPFHSPYMKTDFSEFKEALEGIKFDIGKIPICSNVAGDWDKANQMSSPDYWLNQIIYPVLFKKNVECILNLNKILSVEVGPGSILSSLMMSSPLCSDMQYLVQTMPRKFEEGQEYQFLLTTLGKIWESGIDLDWDVFYKDEKRSKLPLPTTVYERKKFYINPKSLKMIKNDVSPNVEKENTSFVDQHYPLIQNGKPKLSPMEFVINLWKEVLGYEEISLDKNFFDLGGDSLISAQLVSRINKYYSINLNSSIIFDYPLLSSLIEYIQLQLSQNKFVEYQNIAKKSVIEKPLPLTSAQKRLWFLHLFNPELPIYNLAQGLIVRGAIKFDLLEKAIMIVLSRHDVFRTRFMNSHGEPVAFLEEKLKKNIKFIDFKELSYAKKIQNINNHIQLQTHIPFDFTKTPLYQIIVYKIDINESRLVLYIPHILSDGWSFDIFHHELEAIYAGLLNSKHYDLDENSIQYMDYAIWQAENENSSQVSVELDFWKQYLSSSLSVLQLPTDFYRPVEMKGNGDTYQFQLADDAAFISLQKLSTVKKCTHFSLVLSALSVLLYKYSGQQDITIGTAYANREHDQLDNVFGFFINMLPIHMQFDTSLSFNQLIDKVMYDMNQLVKNSAVNFDQIVDALNVERIENINPVFQIMVAYQNYMKASNSENDVIFEPVFLNRGISEYDLSFYIWEEKNCISAAIEYSTELFKISTIKRFVNHFKYIFGLLIENSNLVIDDFQLTTDEERNQLLFDLNKTYCDYSAYDLFPKLFSEISQKFKNKIAVNCDAANISYQDLERYSNQLANFLIEKKIKKGDLIGIYLERAIDLLILLLGIQKSGAIYVPLDPDFPESRIKLIIEDSQLNLILSQRSLEKKLKSINKDFEILYYDDLKQEISAQSCRMPEVDIQKDDLVYILYTSGSTGKPNGVCISHFSLLNFLLSMQKIPGISSMDVVLALTTLSFDISGLELYLPLISGASLELITHQEAVDGYLLKNIISNRKITIMQATPATFQLLLDSGWQEAQSLKILCGGEAMPLKLANHLIQLGADLWNMYGPTETTIWSSVYHLTIENQRPLIGKPIDNTQFFILDNHMNPVPVGIAGELYIGGAGVAKGYLNKPDLSKKRFIHNPFKNIGSEIIYKTGDLVRLMDDGNLEYISRLDFQIKIRGYRIELQDIETALSQFPGVKQAVCTIISISDTDKRILAYIRPENTIEEASIKSFLKDILPNYMIPNHYYFLDDFPLTPNGKVDRNSFPKIDVNQFKKNIEYKKPRNKMESEMALVWEKILNISLIGIEENFFDLGGHSLLATKLIHQLNATLNYKLNLRDLFSNPTIAQLANLVQTNAESNIPLLFPVQPKGNTTPLFLVAGVYDHLYYKDDALINLYEEDFLRYFNNLIVNIGVDRPIYGLRPKGILLNEKFHKNVTIMAKNYIEEIKTIQDSGPYLIGGECLGGIVAYEIAQQLTAGGDEVALCILMDTYRPDYFFDAKYRLNDNKNKILHIIKKLSKNYNNIIQKSNTLLKLYRKIIFPISKNDRLMRRMHLGSSIYARKLISYRPLPYSGKVLLLINEVWNKQNPNLNWTSKYTRNLILSVVQGSHETRLTAYGKQFGRVLKDLINKEMLNYQ